MIDGIMATLRDVGHAVSPFDSTSTISAVNRGERVVAGEHLTALLRGSQRVCALSGGAFDPTLAPLINLWGFGYADADPDAVTDRQITEALNHVGIMECRIDDNGCIVKKSPQTEFNFSAIAKGYGCDCVGRMLEAHGINDYMVEIGGEIAVAGMNPAGQPWNIQIDAPEIDNLDNHASLTVISVTDCGIATSGNYRNYHERADGSRYGHTISAVTGRPVVTSTLSATVIAPTAMDADALATACMAMDADKAIAMIDAIDDTACLLVTDDNGEYRIIPSKLWRERQTR